MPNSVSALGVSNSRLVGIGLWPSSFECRKQKRCGPRRFEWHGTAGLRELRAVGLDDEGQVRIDRSVHSERLLQARLPGRAREQVRASHDIIHLLIGIVHHHGELVGEHAIAPADDHIPERAQLEAAVALKSILDQNGLVLFDAEARGGGRRAGGLSRQVPGYP